MLFIISFAVCGTLVYILVHQLGRRKEQQLNKVELNRRASLDDILKNNKDRFVG